MSEKLGDAPSSPEAVLQLLEAQHQTLAAEIHDGILPYLFAAAASIESLRRGDPALSEKLGKAANWVDQSREVARQIMANSEVPEAVIENPVNAAREFLTSLELISTENPQGGRPDFSKDAPSVSWQDVDQLDSVRWPPALAKTTYRVVCELVRNAIRHANASNIHIEITRSHDPEHWALIIRDDGCGFDTALAINHFGGLRLMHERAALAGARLRIESSIASDSGQVGSTIARLEIPSHKLAS